MIPPSPKADILVVDDSESTVQTIRDILVNYNYAVRAVLDGSAALAVIEEEPPDLLLLDINMDGIDGYEVCRRIKARSTTAHIPVIFITGRHDVGDKIAGFATGGVDYITKPYHATELVSRIETHLAGLRVRRRLELTNATLDPDSDLEQEASLDLGPPLDLSGTLGHVEDGPTMPDRGLSPAELIQLKTAARQIGHEFNNHLSIIAGFSQLMLRDATDSKAEARASAILDAAWSLASLNQEVGTFGRRSNDRSMGPLDPRETCEDLCAIYGLAMREGGDVNVVASEDIWQVRINGAAFERVLTALVANAAEATGHLGQITIALTNEPSADGDASGDMVRITVVDDGPGLPPHIAERIFEPFAGTKQTQGAAGMGLTTAIRTARLYGGSLSVASDPGHTTATIRLRRSREVPTGRLNREQPLEPTILIADRSGPDRALLASIFNQMEYRVLEAESAEEALAYADRYGVGLDLVVTGARLSDRSPQSLAETIALSLPGLLVHRADVGRNAVLATAEALVGTTNLSSVDVLPFAIVATALKVRRTLVGSDPYARI